MRQTPLTHSAQVRQIIVARRRSSKLSQQELAIKLGISQNRLSEIETGQAKLTIDRLLELFNVLGLELLVQERQSAGGGEW
ncbi:MAG: hypothetical protein A3G80_10975 [Betaproteobacteria bacterium RIFCSPLOWO2_12_FULL_62_13b]|nr:MAG: hypothetical protein A3G80_10975 [Betaproteobacteria bacterium RIFCSPLOWO2_12_FULL_62_13b]